MKILAVFAHPDDEILGCGGTLIKHSERGDQITLFALSSGEGSRGEIADDIKRDSQFYKVGIALNATTIQKHFTDNAFDTHALLELSKAVSEVVEQVKPDIIYTHHANDLNVDHRLTFQAVLIANRPMPTKKTSFFIHPSIYSFEVLSSTEWQDQSLKSFIPNHFVDISLQLEKKKNLMKLYKDELRDYPHPRSLEGIEILAKYRGITVGSRAVEAFETIRTRG